MSDRSYFRRQTTLRMKIASMIVAVLLLNDGWLRADELNDLRKVVITDSETQLPVPLVELRTTGQVQYFTDNAGVIALDAPELKDREIWLSVQGHGYEVPADGFGMRGVRLKSRSNETTHVSINRTIIAERIGRLTGLGLLSESQKLGEYSDWHESTVVGCDSVQLTVYRGQAFWNWGDTNVSKYPLGNFHMTGALTGLDFFQDLKLPLRPNFGYFLKPDGYPKPMAAFPGKGPTWLNGYVSLKDDEGKEHLVACYRKIKPPLDAYEIGLCEWNDQAKEFEATQVLWRESEGKSSPDLIPDSHAVRWTDSEGKRWVLFGNPFPTCRIPDSYSAWNDTSKWEALSVPSDLKDLNSDGMVKPHSGSMAWNEYRKRWVTIFLQKFGKPSAFGELWFADAPSPFGPWSPAVKVVSHDNYTFYNPRVHGELSPLNSPFLYFEGTYTHTFANRPHPTPRYDYNQILYRLNLDDRRLKRSE
jgi:hypothetical protein